MGGAEHLGDSLVFLGQDAAGRVDQAPTGLHHARRAIQNCRLLGGHLLDRLQTLTPFQIRVAAQRAQAGTGGVDQYPVDLAGQALNPIIPLVGQGRRMHIGQSAACQPGLERIQAMGRGIKGVKPAGAAHGRTNSQRFATRAGTKIHHHFASLGVQQQGQQLRALVLHFEVAAHKGLMLVQRRLALDAQAPGRKWGGCRFDTALGQRLLDVSPARFEIIDPQVQPRTGVQTLHQGPKTCAELRLQRLHQPLRQVVAVPLHQILRVDLLAGVQPIFFLVGERTAQKIAWAIKTQYRQTPLFGTTARRCQMVEQQFFAQHRVRGLCQGGPLAWP